jgi:hypothetical protein
MSFLSVLKSIGSIFSKVDKVVQPLEPIINVVPGGAAFNTIFNSIIQVEQLFEGITSNPQTSAAKLSIATQVIAAKDPTLNTPALPGQINNVVTGLNTLQTVQSSVAAPPTVS